MSSPGAADRESGGLDPVDVRVRLELLADLGHGFLESGQTGAQTERVLDPCAAGVGLRGASFTAIGRILLLEATLPDGGTATLSGAAHGLDTIDCSRLRSLDRIADELMAGELAEHGKDQQKRLAELSAAVTRIRGRSTSQWIVVGGMTLLAFFISMQVGVTWQAWVSAAAVELITCLVGIGVVRLRMPKLFAAILQSTAGGTFATALVLLGFVSPVGAAVAIAVTWLLLLPLPQIISGVGDAIEGDYLSALSRASSVVVVAAGIVVGGALTFSLGEVLGMQHPGLEELPSLPWYLTVTFSGLGALANAFANGGRRSLIVPAVALGVITSLTNLALQLVGLPLVWSSALSAVVLGAITVVMAARIGYPQQVLALMGVTGALLPGLTVFFGILQLMGGESGLEHLGAAAGIVLGVGAGVAGGTYLAGWGRPLRLRRQPRPRQGVGPRAVRRS
ncbi:MAG: threonine/serine exporter family protein [Microbacterium sp.]|uniref:threonine/serine exporter family protein n=1 Tax=Microbacterium sp. TaxID=51671 RepID=UPI0039E72507